MITWEHLNRRPSGDEYFEYYDMYVRLVPDGRCWELLEAQVDQLQSFLSEVSEAESSMLHAPYRWTIKQVVGHLIDTERVFADRLHRFASGDSQPQSGMDQELYVSSHDYESPTLSSLIRELHLCRQANLLLIRRLKSTAFSLQGQASKHMVSVRALAWMMVGHIIHHTNIVHQRLGR